MNELFAFFVASANSVGEGVIPIDYKAKEDVLLQMLGTTKQAGSTKVLSIASEAV